MRTTKTDLDCVGVQPGLSLRWEHGRRYVTHVAAQCHKKSFMPNLHFITKTNLYNFDPLKPHFYIVKLGLTGVYIIFLISAQKHRLWVLVRTASARRF